MAQDRSDRGKRGAPHRYARRVVLYIWNDRNRATEPAKVLDLPAVPREGDTVALEDMARGRVTHVHWDFANGIVHVHAS